MWQIMLCSRYWMYLLVISENPEKEYLDLQYSLNGGGVGSGSDDHVAKCESREDTEAGNNKPLFC